MRTDGQNRDRQQQLLTYIQMQIQTCVEAQITCVRNLLHAKLRSDLRLKISEAAARREKSVQDEKFMKAIKFITGQHQYFYNVDSLMSHGTITTDPIQIHDRLTEAFAENFICPQQYKHSPLQSDDGMDSHR